MILISIALIYVSWQQKQDAKVFVIYNVKSVLEFISN